MSIFNEILPRVLDIQKKSAKNLNDGLEEILKLFDKFEEDLNRRTNAREKKDKTLITTLQSIDEDDDEPNKAANMKEVTTNHKDNNTAQCNDNVKGRSSMEAGPVNAKKSTEGQRASKKRSKAEVEDMASPGLDKRQKRNASVRAQSIISKQVNVNLTQKMRREDSPHKRSRGRRRGADKENEQPALLVQIKQEKISLLPAPEPMDAEPLACSIKRELSDGSAMPPPAAAVPRPRRAPQKQRSEDSSGDEGSSRRRAAAPAPVPLARSTRNSARQTKTLVTEEEQTAPPAPPAPEPAPAQSRPKRTRGKKKLSEPHPSNKSDDESRLQENTIGSPAEKPRPKRTRRGQKAAEKHLQSQNSQDSQESGTEPETVTPKEEPAPQPEPLPSPVLQRDSRPVKNKKLQKQDSDELKTAKTKGKSKKVVEQQRSLDEMDSHTETNLTKDGARVVIEKMNVTITLDKTMVLTDGVYNHLQVTPKSVNDVNNATVVLERLSRDSAPLDKAPHAVMDATVVLEKDANGNLTQDESLLTDDNSGGERTPPARPAPAQPTSAVKEKVQQFEEMAARTTRTKTRAMAKLGDAEAHTPPERAPQAALPADTLSKMNSLIFNGKLSQVSSSGTKPRAPAAQKPAPASVQRQRAADDLKKEDARGKKEALLEAKRELQKKKREEKMAAAAAARDAAERGRRLAMEAAAREREEKQAHADLGKIERLREVERKKLELARKVAETEERRRAEELARRQRLADEQRRASEQRRRQLREAEASKKESAMMAKEIEKKQKEYIEKQKKKLDKMHTPLKGAFTPPEPVYMCDGFQYLNSDEEEQPQSHPIPAWSSSKMRRLTLQVQSRVRTELTDSWFGVRVHSPDLREIFPAIDRSRLHRTSSAVWRTPPAAQRLPALPE